MKQFESKYDRKIRLIEWMPKFLIEQWYYERYNEEFMEYAINHFRDKLDKLKLLRFKEYNERKSNIIGR